MYLYIDPSSLLNILYMLLNTCEQEALTWASHEQQQAAKEDKAENSWAEDLRKRKLIHSYHS